MTQMFRIQIASCGAQSLEILLGLNSNCLFCPQFEDSHTTGTGQQNVAQTSKRKTQKSKRKRQWVGPEAYRLYR
jgi:hypothetical protein